MPSGASGQYFRSLSAFWLTSSRTCASTQIRVPGHCVSASRINSARTMVLPAPVGHTMALRAATADAALLGGADQIGPDHAPQLELGYCSGATLIHANQVGGDGLRT